MAIILGIIGFFAGLFLWSSIFGSIFGTLPVEKQMVKAGVIQSVRWGRILTAIMFATIVLTVTAIFVTVFFYGTLVAAFVLLFNVGSLRAEAIQNFKDEMQRVSPNKNS